jgi:hypothetical protein
MGIPAFFAEALRATGAKIKISTNAKIIRE